MIKNLIPGLPEHGKIKSGTKGEEVLSAQGKKFRLPVKLDHYIITTTERDKEGTLILDTELMDALKASGEAIVDDKGNLVGLPIRLLYNDIQLNFPNRYACYSGSRCICSGDGVAARTRDGRDIKCPCEKLDFNYEGKDKCKANGRLSCIIDGASMVGACHVLRTTSINSVKSILGGLAFIQAAASGLLAFLPLHLILKPKSVITPSGASTTVYISSIVYRGSIQELRQQTLIMAKDKAKYLIEMDTVEESARELMSQATETPEEQADIQEEFYPDAIDVEVKDVPKEKKVEMEEVEEERPDTEPESEPEQPDQSSREPESETVKVKMIVKEQKKQIVILKKEKKITNPETWLALLKPFGVKTANDLTYDQAEEFIEVLKQNP